jgi:hypothetical protein
MLNFLRIETDPFMNLDSPIIYDSHDDYTPDPVEPEPVFVEEPEFLAAERASSLEYLGVHG